MSCVYSNDLHIPISYVSDNIDSLTGKKFKGNRETNFITASRTKEKPFRLGGEKKTALTFAARGQQMIAHANRRVLTNGTT